MNQIFISNHCHKQVYRFILRISLHLFCTFHNFYIYYIQMGCIFGNKQKSNPKQPNKLTNPPTTLAESSNFNSELIQKQKSEKQIVVQPNQIKVDIPNQHQQNNQPDNQNQLTSYIKPIKKKELSSTQKQQQEERRRAIRNLKQNKKEVIAMSLQPKNLSAITEITQPEASRLATFYNHDFPSQIQAKEQSNIYSNILNPSSLPNISKIPTPKLVLDSIPQQQYIQEKNINKQQNDKS